MNVYFIKVGITDSSKYLGFLNSEWKVLLVKLYIYNFNKELPNCQ